VAGEDLAADLTCEDLRGGGEEGSLRRELLH
jgi:hypothetical protein